MKTILLTIGVIAVAMILRMKEDGIHCALSEDKLSRRKRKLQI